MNKITYIIFCLIILLTACQNEHANSSEFQISDALELSLEEDEGYLNNNESYKYSRDNTNQPAQLVKSRSDRKVIKIADYRFQVEDVKSSTERVEQILKDYEAYISTMNMSNSTYETNNKITIRVPQKNFDTLMDVLGKESIYTNYKRVKSQDVTEEFVDIQSRLKTKKEVRDRYIDILRNKAKNVEDILNAEDKIRVLQEEIEAQEGRLRYLNDRVGMSTINLEIYQKVEHSEQPAVYKYAFGKKFVKALKNGWYMALGAILFMVNLWPFILFGALIFWKRRWFFGRLKFRRTKQKG